MDYGQFFAELLPRLQTARNLNRALDRTLAHRFNVFDYLRYDELGLSRVIADLLDPEAQHGQGTLFLSAFLSLDGVRQSLCWPTVDECDRITVVTELVITGSRRIDVSVEMTNAGKIKYCLAIENKPYASDQKDQVADYMDYLEDQYEDRALLVYLSPAGEGPSAESIDAEKLRHRQKHFVIMAYCAGAGNRDRKYERYRARQSLADWFEDSRRRCEVDRLRWFLRDAERFCQRTFGGLTMTRDAETKAILELALRDQDNLDVAYAVSQAWPAVSDTICRKFFQLLGERITAAASEDDNLKDYCADIDVICDYGDGQRWQMHIYLYGRSWYKYRYAEKDEAVSCVTICMNNSGAGPNGWGAGVASPLSRDEMTETDQGRHDRLVQELGGEFGAGHSTVWWPYWIMLEPDKRDWDPLVPVLKREMDDGGGPVADYYVRTFLNIARRAYPRIQRLEDKWSEA